MVLRHGSQPGTRVYQSDRASRTACRTATHPADHNHPDHQPRKREICDVPLDNGLSISGACDIILACEQLFAMTSQGHPLARFQRALENGNPDIVIPAALELPRPILLRDGLRVLLVLRDRAPDRYPLAAARWAASFITRRKLTLADAQLAVAALQALASDHPVAGGQALEALLERYGEQQAAGHLGDWLSRRED